MSLLKKLRLGGHCPNCHEKILELEIYRNLTFCPHCHVNLYPKIEEISDEQGSNQSKKLKRLSTSVILAFVLFVVSDYRETEIFRLFNEVLNKLIIVSFILFLVGTLVYMVFFRKYAKKNMHAGVDNLNEIKMDSCDYVSHNQVKPLKCSNCHSIRLVDLYWYKRLLANTYQKIPYIANSEKTDDFIGCLRCQSQFEKKVIVFDKSAYPFLFVLFGLPAIFFVFRTQIFQLFELLNGFVNTVPYGWQVVKFMFFTSYFYFLQNRRVSNNHQKTRPQVVLRKLDNRIEY